MDDNTLNKFKQIAGDDFKTILEKSRGGNIHILPYKKLIRNKLHIAKHELSKEQVAEIKKRFVDITPYVKKVLSLPNEEKYYFLQILVELSIDEHSAFKGSNSQDCKIGDVMKLATKFNEIYMKSRSLDGCYDCGTIGRAVFMSWKQYKEECFKDRCPIRKIAVNREESIIDEEYNFPISISGEESIGRARELSMTNIDKCLERLKDKRVNKYGNILFYLIILINLIKLIDLIDLI
jgi:hypothetical protein